MYTRLTAVPNRTLLYDVYQYVWDAKETTMLLDSYIAWLGECDVVRLVCHSVGCQEIVMLLECTHTWHMAG